MKTGPRLFAAAVLTAAVVLPKTGWIVKNELDLLGGGWGPYGETSTIRFGLVPRWAFEPEAISDPVGKAVAESVVHGQSWSERWAWVRPLLRDPRVREADRGAVLRRSFTSVLLRRHDPSVTSRVRDIAKELLPLTREGEIADPFNAFYPTCRAVLETVEGRKAEADAALRRASECTCYDDDAWGETDRFTRAFEREYGYRGNNLRLTKAASVLLPQHAAFNHLVKNLVAKAPMNDARRRQILGIGRTMVQAGNTSITIYMGRSLLLRAVGQGKDPEDEVNVERWFAPFERANPDYDAREAKRLIRAAKPEDLLDFDDFETGAAPFATTLGAAGLIGVLGALALSLPTRKGVDESFGGRAARANWSWLVLLPGVALDGRPEATGVFLLFALASLLVCGLSRFSWGLRPAVGLAVLAAFAGFTTQPFWAVPGLLWLGAALAPERARAIVAGVVMTLAAGCVAWRVSKDHAPSLFSTISGHSPTITLLSLGILIFVMKKTLPSRSGMGALPAAMAALWLAGLGLELIADAQTGAALERLRHEAADFRKGRAI